MPFHVAIADGGLEIVARIKNEGDVESLIQVLQAMKPLLPTVYGLPKATVAPPEASDRAERVFETSMEGPTDKELI